MAVILSQDQLIKGCSPLSKGKTSKYKMITLLSRLRIQNFEN